MHRDVHACTLSSVCPPPPTPPQPPSAHMWMSAFRHVVMVTTLSPRTGFDSMDGADWRQWQNWRRLFESYAAQRSGWFWDLQEPPGGLSAWRSKFRGIASRCSLHIGWERHRCVVNCACRMSCVVCSVSFICHIVLLSNPLLKTWLCQNCKCLH